MVVKKQNVELVSESVKRCHEKESKRRQEKESNESRMNLPPRPWCYAVFLALIIALYYTVQLKEEFIDRYCNEHRTCKDCTRRIGCAWCGEAKKCVLKTSMNGDPKCNADTAIMDSLNCTATSVEKEEPTQLEEAYHEVRQKPQPPMVFTNSEMQYSPETIMASVGKIGTDVTKLQQDLPEMIRTTVRQSMKGSTKK
jgi:hypothetical protein